MKTQLAILIVEDDDTAYKTVSDAVDLINREEAENETSHTEIICERATTFLEAVEKLRNQSQRFEAAIIDVRLAEDMMAENQSDMELMGGRKLVDLILKEFQLPVFVYTGTPGHIEALKPRVSAFFKVYKKDEKTADEILSEIIDLNRSGLLSILGADGIIQTFGKHFHQIFWTHLAQVGEYWLTLDNRDALKRYVAQHLMEYLEQAPEGGFSPMHPGESYITPAVKKNIFTGDILRNERNGTNWVVLTPACDMVIYYKKSKNGDDLSPYRKADFVVLAALIPWKLMPGLKDKEGNLIPDPIKKLKEYDSPSHYRYTFLPRYHTISASFIDFQQLISIPTIEIDNVDNFCRITTISNPFLKDIIAKFSYYFSRQGAPSLAGDMKEWIGPLTS